MCVDIAVNPNKGEFVLIRWFTKHFSPYAAVRKSITQCVLLSRLYNFNFCADCTIVVLETISVVFQSPYWTSCVQSSCLKDCLQLKMKIILSFCTVWFLISTNYVCVVTCCSSQVQLLSCTSLNWLFVVNCILMSLLKSVSWSNRQLPNLTNLESFT